MAVPVEPVPASALIDSAMSSTRIRASPIAVPSRGFRVSIASSSLAWSAVGSTSGLRAADANDTIPTRIPAGSCFTNEWAAALAASSRVGATSVAFMEPETSMARMTVESSRGTARTIVGRASPITRNAMATRYSAAGTWRRHEGRFGARLARRSRLVKRTA